MKNLHVIPELQCIEVIDYLALRPLKEDDAEELLSVIDSDPDIRARVKFARDIQSAADVKEEVSKYTADPDTMRYAVAMGEHVVGLVSFWRLGTFKGMNEPDTYGFGYFLDPSARGKSIITSSVRSLMSAAQKSITVDRFIAWCEDDNAASIATLEKCGFIPTDQVDYFPDEQWHERLYEAHARQPRF